MALNKRTASSVRTGPAVPTAPETVTVAAPASASDACAETDVGGSVGHAGAGVGVSTPIGHSNARVGVGVGAGVGPPGSNRSPNRPNICKVVRNSPMKRLRAAISAVRMTE